MPSPKRKNKLTVIEVYKSTLRDGITPDQKDFMKKYNALRKAFTIRYLNTKSFPKGEVAEIPDKLPPQSLTNDEAMQRALTNLFKQTVADK